MSDLSDADAEWNQHSITFDEFDKAAKELIAKLQDSPQNCETLLEEIDYCMAKMRAITEYEFEAEYCDRVLFLKMRFTAYLQAIHRLRQQLSY